MIYVLFSNLTIYFPLSLPFRGGERKLRYSPLSPSPTGEGWGEAVSLPFRGGLGRGCSAASSY